MTYKEMYFYLYAQMANALDYFYVGKTIQGICTLEQAQEITEEMFLEMDIIRDSP